jgi:hypothetical protein
MQPRSTEIKRSGFYIGANLRTLSCRLLATKIARRIVHAFRKSTHWPEKLPVTEAPPQSHTGLRIFRSQLHHISEAPHSLA